MNLKISKFILFFSIFSFLLVFSIFYVWGTESPISENKAKAIASKLFKEPSSVEYFLKLNINTSILPPPSVVRQGKMLLVDYKDVIQNIWIVVIVHPDGSTEVSHTKIKEESEGKDAIVEPRKVNVLK